LVAGEYGEGLSLGRFGLSRIVLNELSGDIPHRTRRVLLDRDGKFRLWHSQNPCASVCFDSNKWKPHHSQTEVADEPRACIAG
jgi:hypothetical protein